MTKTTKEQRARFRELTYPCSDDYGLTALRILDDLEAAEKEITELYAVSIRAIGDLR